MSNFIRYEPKNEFSSKAPVEIIPSKFIWEWRLVGNEWKWINTRITIVQFHAPASHYLSSAELDGWGSCSVKGDSNFPPNREQLITMGYVRPGALLLDHIAWRNHRRDRFAIEKATRIKAKPVDNRSCDCGMCVRCAQRWSDQFEPS